MQPFTLCQPVRRGLSSLVLLLFLLLPVALRAQSVNMELFINPQPSLYLASTSNAVELIPVDSVESLFYMNRLLRCRGFLIPPLTGYYRFQFSHFGSGALYLSTDSTEYHKQLIRYYPYGPCCPEVFLDSLWLEAGKPHYFEALDGISDTPHSWLQLKWMPPGDSLFRTISGTALAPAPPRPHTELPVWELFHDRVNPDLTALATTSAVADETYRLDSLNVRDFISGRDQFVSRIRGYLLPPVSGTYEFFLAADDRAQFRLSPDTSRANAVLMNEIDTIQTDWSQSVSLQELFAGERYYFELMHYDSVYRNVLRLGWRFPGDPLPVTIRSLWMTGHADNVPVQAIRLNDDSVTAYPGWSFTPAYRVFPWNAEDQRVTWQSDNPAVATVNSAGGVTTLATGLCFIIVRSVASPLVADTLQLTVTGHPGPFFVRANAPESGSGFSWEDPARLMQVLGLLQRGNPPPALRVFVAEGEYRPTPGIDRTASFIVKNATLLGGYAASSTGTDTTQRDIEAHETILSGDIGLPNTNLDNSYHVVKMRGTAAIDGFTIRGGRANCRYYGTANTYDLADNSGGGVLLESSQAFISHCNITSNSAFNGGGGIYSGNHAPTGCCLYGKQLILRNCRIHHNLIQQNVAGPADTGSMFVVVANGYGAGMALLYTNGLAEDCRISSNRSLWGMGTAAYLAGSGSVTLRRCSVDGNSGYYEEIWNSGLSTMTLENTTLKGRFVTSFGSTSHIVNSTIVGGGYTAFDDNHLVFDNSIWTQPNFNFYEDSWGNTWQANHSILGDTLYGADRFEILSDTVPAFATWLDTVAFNGGPTPTMRLKNVPGNPAKTNGNPLWLGATDQRGFLRNDTVSIGAYQWTWPSQILIDPQQASMAPGDTLPFTVTVLPAWADDKTWSASSSDASVIGMAETALVAVEEGNARVTVRTHDASRSDTCFVTVLPDSITASGTVHSGNAACYSALGTLAVAGSGTPFLVKNGGSAHLIAGERIRLLTGTKVEPGGTLLGEIAPQGPWCQPFKEELAGSPVVQEDAVGTASRFRVWPNPTGGRFHIKTSRAGSTEPTQVRCFDQTGLLLFSVQLQPGTSQTLSLEDRAPGLYLLQLMQGGRCDVVKILKQ